MLFFLFLQPTRKEILISAMRGSKSEGKGWNSGRFLFQIARFHGPKRSWRKNWRE